MHTQVPIVFYSCATNYVASMWSRFFS